MRPPFSQRVIDSQDFKLSGPWYEDHVVQVFREIMHASMDEQETISLRGGFNVF